MSPWAARIPAHNPIAIAKRRRYDQHPTVREREHVRHLFYKFRAGVIGPDGMCPRDREAVQEYILAEYLERHAPVAEVAS